MASARAQEGRWVEAGVVGTTAARDPAAVTAGVSTTTATTPAAVTRAAAAESARCGAAADRRTLRAADQAAEPGATAEAVATQVVLTIGVESRARGAIVIRRSKDATL